MGLFCIRDILTVHQEFSDIEPIRYAGPNYQRPIGGFYPLGEPGDDADDPHGTSVLSKLSGKVHGVIKRPSRVNVVRTAKPCDIECWLDMLTWIIEDWKNNRDDTMVKVAVGSISIGTEWSILTAEDLLKLPRWEERMVAAMDEGILLICSAGNYDQVMWIGFWFLFGAFINARNMLVAGLQLPGALSQPIRLEQSTPGAACAGTYGHRFNE